MTAEPQPTTWTVGLLLDLFDVEPDGQDRFIAQSGLTAGADERQVVEGTQVLAQAIVAAAKRFPDKSIRSVHSVFTRAVLVGPPIVLDVEEVEQKADCPGGRLRFGGHGFPTSSGRRMAGRRRRRRNTMATSPTDVLPER